MTIVSVPTQTERNREVVPPDQGRPPSNTAFMTLSISVLPVVLVAEPVRMRLMKPRKPATAPMMTKGIMRSSVTLAPLWRTASCEAPMALQVLP